MKLIQLDLSQEKKLITNLIMSSEFCKEIIPLLNINCLASPYSRIVSGWVVEFYEKYECAPERTIQDIYRDKKSSIQNEDDQEMVATFLEHLSQEYEKAIPNNVEYSVQQATEYLNIRNLEILNEEIKQSIEAQDVQAAQKALAGYQPIAQNVDQIFSRIGQLEIKPPEWLVQGLFEKNSTNVLFGDPGVGKSFLALDIGACIASKTDFHIHGTEARGPVIYLCGEGRATIARRCKAWAIENQVNLTDIPFYILNKQIQLLDEKSLLPLKQTLRTVSEQDGPPVLLIVDTWNRLEGGDENSNSDTAKAIAALDHLREPYNCAVLIVHHSGNSEKQRARGASALNAAADNTYKVEKRGDGSIVMACTKCKDGLPSAPMAFRLADVDLGIEDEHNQPVTSAVLQQIDCPDKPKVMTLRGKNQQTLEILQRLLDEGRAVTTAVWRAACEEAGINHSTFFGNRTKLLAGNIISFLPNKNYTINPSVLSTSFNPYRGVEQTRTKIPDLGKYEFQNSQQTRTELVLNIPNDDPSAAAAEDRTRDLSLRLFRQRKAVRQHEKEMDTV